MTPLDMAKFGYLYLNEGHWDGDQIIPANWVKESTYSQIRADTLQNSYGYQWWVDSTELYMALGYMGQFIFVLPNENLVVVFVSELEDRDFYVPQRLLNEYIIPAAKSSEPLSENPEGVARLQSLTEALANP
jgi:CubicO group peptidase (beta-lactamase class C family)